MRTSVKKIRIWKILSIALLPVLFCISILTAIVLDVFVARPGDIAVATLLPGMTYSTAFIMKVSIAQWVAILIVAIVIRLAPDNELFNRTFKVVPTWTVLSLLLTQLAPLLSAVVLLVVQELIENPEGPSLSYFPAVSRIGVFASLSCILAATTSSGVALLTGERPRLLPVISIVTNLFLIFGFWYAEFYKLGFHQDKWSEL